MPLLTFSADFGIDAPDADAFAEAVAEHYAEEMQTETGHVAVSVDADPENHLWLGRSTGGRHLFLDADVRRGRDQAQKRAFALAVIDLAGEHFDVPEANAKVVFTEHEGPQMMGANRVGGEWSPEEE
ncbi:tautomerase family protein [Halospeciosus flavus]|uniref:Tautomerase family protein n=1 Tax=Halospeciosus flavus TaxID=3032283 RepID=A0ABD5Z4H5_9EURY|nr:tautomerase family protein [Halospeciosus flavus]